MNDDAALLHRYAAEGSQEAFAELVRSHLPLVYHAALRQTGGDPHRAEEVAQRVFTDLARKAAALSHRALLVAWLHTATRHAATELRRTEARRLAREHAAFAMNEADGNLAPEPAAEWERLRPLIDDALQNLGERDRAAVLLRFFENRSYAELASTLAVTEDAARVRVNRALEKLRATLAHRGLVSTSAALGLALAQPALAATPASLATSITTASLSAASVAAVGVSAGVATTTVMSTAKIAATAAAAALAVFTIGVAVLPSAPPTTASAHAPTPALSATDLAAILHPARLASAEAAAALAAYLALPPLAADATQTEFIERAARLRALLTLLPAEHMAQLLAATAARLGDPEARLRRIAFTTWTELYAPAASRWAAALETSPAINADQRAAFATQAALAWARSDFDAAYAWSSTLSDAKLTPAVPLELLAWLAATDPEQALALARARGPEFFAKARDPIFSKWAEQDPAAALGNLGAEILVADPESWRVREALARWFKKDFSAGLAWLQTNHEQYGTNNNSLLTNVLIQNHLFQGAQSTVLDGLLRHPEIPQHSEHVSRFLEAWHRQDPAAASAWLARLPDAAARADLIERVVPTGGSDATKAQSYLELAAQLPAGPARDDRIAGWVATWAQADPAAAGAWLEAREKTDPSLAGVADRVEGRLVAALAATDPAAALARFPDLPPEARGAAAPAIALAWAKNDPAAATRWLAEQLPQITLDPHQRTNLIWMSGQSLGTHTVGSNLVELETQTQALSESVLQWSRREPLAALRWAEALTDPLQRKIALDGIAMRGGQGPNYAGTPRPDPQARADLINQIQDPAQRSRYLSFHLGVWLRANEEQARAWLDAHDAFTPEETAKLLEQANRTFP